MTNLEKMKGEISTNICICSISHMIKYKSDCITKKCKDCEFYNNADNCIDVLLSEYKEPVKLKRWEKDLLLVYDEDFPLCSVNTLLKMKNAGYFKGINDVKMTPKEILENCEIVG